MARHVFFSFDLERDYARAIQLRDRWVTRDRSAGGFRHGADWVEVRKRGREGVEAWVRTEMEAAVAVAVLIGEHTARLYYVDYAVELAHSAGIGVVGIRVHDMDDPGQVRGVAGPDPLRTRVDEGGRRLYRTFDWRPGFSDRFLPDWIEQAAREAGR